MPALDTKPCVLILGGASAMLRATAIEFARKGYNLILADREEVETRLVAADITIRYNVAAVARPFEGLDYASHPAFFDDCVKSAGGKLAGVVLGYGYLGDQKKAEADFAEARRIVEINYTSAVSMLGLAANHFETHKEGFIVAVSSVAGDRGRQSNYLYGSAKGALSLFLQGMRNRLAPLGVTVLTVKPGFVDTAMTYGMFKPNHPLVATPAKIGKDIVRAVETRRDVIYTPWFWAIIMLIIRTIPERNNKKLKL